MPNIAYINGRYLPLSQAKVSVEDRGFQFGDGVYELIRSYDGRLFHPETHLIRMARSAAALGIQPIYSRSRWTAILNKILKKSGFRDAKVYIQVTRGAAPREHVFPRPCRPTVVVTVRKIKPLPVSFYKEGVAAITVHDIRWGRCDIKAVNLLPNVMAREKARSAGAYEAIFVRGNQVIEGSSSNVFGVIRKKIVTPPNGPMILPGVTREEVMHLAKAEGYSVVERTVTRAQLMGAEEVFLTGTTAEVLPVVRIDGRRIGSGKPGEVTRLLYRRFRALFGK